MNKEIKFKAVNLNAMFAAFAGVSVLIILIALIAFSIKNTTHQTYFIIAGLSISIIAMVAFLSTQEKMISLFFKDNELWLTENKATSSETNHVTRKWTYSDIKNHNIYSLSLFTKKTGNIVRIRSHKNYCYYLRWVSADKKGEFGKEEFEELKNIFSNKLKINKKREFIDNIIIFLYSVLPQIAGITAVILLIGIFYYIFNL